MTSFLSKSRFGVSSKRRRKPSLRSLPKVAVTEHKIVSSPSTKEVVFKEVIKTVAMLPVAVKKDIQAIYIERPFEKYVQVLPYIFWIGKDELGLFDEGQKYNFNCLWFDDSDLSSLQDAKCLVVSCAEFTSKVSNLVNFACEYGIPAVWLNRYLPLEACYWNFTKMLHTDDAKLFWSSVCQVIE